MSLMLYTQLYRGPIGVSLWPNWNFEEIFKLQNVTAETSNSEVTIADPTRIGLPALDTIKSTTALTLTGEAVSFSPKAAAIALYGNIEKVPAGTVADEAHDAYVNHSIMLEHMPLEVSSVKNATGDVTYERNKDYAVTASGIHVMLGGDLAAHIDAAPDKKLPIKVSYSYPTVDVVKPFTAGQRFYRVLFSQVNEGGNGEKRRIICYYCKIALNGGIPLNQGAEFGTIPVSISIMSDPQIVDVDESAMWRWEIENKDAELAGGV